MSDWINAEQHAEQAHQFYEAGQWEKALAELKLALSVDPSQGDWHMGMGLTLDAMQRYEDAIACFELALRLKGDDTETMLYLAADLIRCDQCPRALKVLQRITDHDPGCEPAYCHKILAHCRLGQHDLAEQAFYLAQQINQDCPHCYNNVAQSLVMTGRLDRALWCWNRALQLDPHHPEARALMGQALYQAGHHERARQLLLEHLRDDPADLDALLVLGALLAELGRPDEAREKFHRALEIDPAYGAAYRHLGELDVRDGRYDAAQTNLETADRLDPQLPGVQLSMARVALRRNNPEQARGHLTAELQRQGHTAAQSLDLARLLIEQGAPTPAAELMTGLLGSQSFQQMNVARRATALTYRGLARIDLGLTRIGLRDARRAARMAPRLPLPLRALVLTYLKLDQTRRAAVYLRRWRSLTPTDPQVRALGKSLRAKRLRQRVLHPTRRR